MGYQGWNSQSVCQNSKQGRPWSDCFYRTSLFWVCSVCLGLLSRKQVTIRNFRAFTLISCTGFRLYFQKFIKIGRWKKKKKLSKYYGNYGGQEVPSSYDTVHFLLIDKQTRLPLFILMDFPMHVDRISMELSILYFKGSKAEISNLGCISVVKICFYLGNQCRLWWNATLRWNNVIMGNLTFLRLFRK